MLVQIQPPPLETIKKEVVRLYTLIIRNDNGDQTLLGQFETAQDGAEAMDEYRDGTDGDVYLMLVREDDDD